MAMIEEIGARLKISAVFLEGWRRRGVEELLPVQKKFIQLAAGGSRLAAGGIRLTTGRVRSAAGGLEAAGNGAAEDSRGVLVSAPTSSGKTWIGEVEIAAALSRGERAVYLVPTKAVAEEKFETFRRWMEGTSHRVICATRDRPESDRPLAAGEYDLAVAVYEKWSRHLTLSPGAMAGVGAVVVDEIQMLRDPERGATLDLLITRMLLSPYRPRMVALAPPLPDAGELAEWLGCELLEDAHRPIELREGVLDISTGLFRYHSGRTESEEILGLPEEFFDLARDAADGPGRVPDPWAGGTLGAAALLARRGEPVLLFAPTRAASRFWADYLARLPLDLPAARRALSRISGAEPSRLNEWMIRCLEHGVAFHNADLTAWMRERIERGFNEKEIRIIVATPTLGLGVNLAARNVIHFPWRITREGDAGVARAPLDRARFSDQGGRAGRLGWEDSFGRSILVAQSRAEADHFWERLIRAELPPLPAPLGDSPPAGAALEFLSGGIRRSAENLTGAMSSTWSARRLAGYSPAKVERMIEACARRHLIRSAGEEGMWELTGLGEAVAAAGIEVETAARFHRALMDGILAEPIGLPGAAFDVFFLVGMTAEGRRATAPLRSPRSFCIDGVKEKSPGARCWSAAEFRDGGPSAAEAKALLAAAIMTDWIDGIDGEVIEEDYRTSCGIVASIGSEYSWLIHSVGSIAAAAGRTTEEVEGLKTLGERTQHGIPEEGLFFTRRGIAELNRCGILKLIREGIDSPIALVESRWEGVAEIVGQDLADLLLRRTHQPSVAAKPTPVRRRKHDLPNGKEKAGWLLEINFQSPGIVRAAGREIALTPLAFELLAALAERPGEVVTRAALYQRLWPEGGPEDQQLDGHRRTLIRRLRPALGAGAASVAEVVRGIGFRLTISGERITMRTG